MPSDWMNEEKQRAIAAVQTGQLPNSNAPQLVRAKPHMVPPRVKRTMYLQEHHAFTYEDLVHAQKRATGKKGPDLLEEALELLFEKYGVDFQPKG